MEGKFILGALALAVCGYFLREFGWRGAPLFFAVALCVLSRALVSRLPVLSTIYDEAAALGAPEDTVKTVLKVLGIGYLTSVTVSVCRELGAESLSRVASLAGRAEILAAVLPAVLSLLRSGAEMIG